MKRIDDGDRSQRLRAMRLFRGDLEDILACLQQSGFGTIRLTHENFEFESLDELMRERGKVLGTLTIEGRNDTPWMDMTITFEHDETRIISFTHGTTPVILQLKEILNNRQRTFGALTGLMLRAVVGGVGFGGLVLSGGRLWSGSSSSWWLVLVGSIVLGALALRLPLKTAIYLERKHEHQNFWQRHGDFIIKTGIGTVFGYLVRLLQEIATKK